MHHSQMFPFRRENQALKSIIAKGKIRQGQCIIHYYLCQLLCDNMQPL